MDNLDNKNKVWESFENHLPEEQLPAFIWDNVLNELEKATPVVESTEKVKDSFENGFEEAALPVFLWDDIVGELDANSTLDADLTTTNKIKTSFEGKFDEALPEYLWDSVENQLEVESVWQGVNKALNKRTKARYWREKAVQLSLAALAILWIRGCDIGDANYTNPSSTFAVHQIESNEGASNKTTSSSTDKMDLSTIENPLKNTGGNNLSDKPLVKKNQSPAIIPSEEKTLELARDKAKHQEEKILQVNKEKSTKNSTVDKENEPPVLVAINVTKEKNRSSLKNVSKEKSNGIEHTVVLGSEDPSGSKIANQTKNSDNKVLFPSLEETYAGAAPKDNSGNENLSSKAKGLQSKGTLANATTPNLGKEEVFVKKEYPQNMLPALLGEYIPVLVAENAIQDSTIYTVKTFYLENPSAKKKSIRFELGLLGKVGTSLLLGNATNKAMETTSMVKTEIRPAGGVGIQFNAYLSPNDAIVFGAFPFSVSRQYFGGYTNRGRFYHKEIKLSYFDFSLGYQRTLLRYNDFGNVPSTIYARLEYGLGYLNKGEEVVNGELVEAGETYKKLNHNIGLAIGTTHHIKRFVIDYGINASVGLSSILSNPSAAPAMEETNLMNVGGYIGLRYML